MPYIIITDDDGTLFERIQVRARVTPRPVSAEEETRVLPALARGVRESLGKDYLQCDDCEAFVTVDAEFTEVGSNAYCPRCSEKRKPKEINKS